MQQQLSMHKPICCGLQEIRQRTKVSLILAPSETQHEIILLIEKSDCICSHTLNAYRLILSSGEIKKPWSSNMALEAFGSALLQQTSCLPLMKHHLCFHDRTPFFSSLKSHPCRTLPAKFFTTGSPDIGSKSLPATFISRRPSPSISLK